MTIHFHKLISSIACAVVEAQNQVRKSHIGELHSLFKDDGSPIMVKFQIPKVSSEKENQVVCVPLITLINPSQLSIQEMRVKMTIDMHEPIKAASTVENSGKPESSENIEEKSHVQSYEWKSSKYQSSISTSTMIGKKSDEVGIARVTLKVKTEDVPEGLARLLNHYNQSL